MVKLIIPGKPIALKRHRSTRSGKMYDPSSKDKQQTWLQIARHKPRKPLTGFISLKMTFYMPRPKSHYRTGKYSHILKANAPRSFHSVKPDIDNLVKFYSDVLAMNEGFYVDDSQICALAAIKVYSWENNPRTEVTIQEI